MDVRRTSRMRHRLDRPENLFTRRARHEPPETLEIRIPLRLVAAGLRMAIAAVESRGQISIVAWRIGEPASVNHRPLNHATSPTAGVRRSLTHHIVVRIERQHVGSKRPLCLPRRERSLLGQLAGHGDESGTERHRAENPTPGHIDLKRPGWKRDVHPRSRRAFPEMVSVLFTKSSRTPLHLLLAAKRSSACHASGPWPRSSFSSRPPRRARLPSPPPPPAPRTSASPSPCPTFCPQTRRPSPADSFCSLPPKPTPSRASHPAPVSSASISAPRAPANRSRSRPPRPAHPKRRSPISPPATTPSRPSSTSTPNSVAPTVM